MKLLRLDLRAFGPFTDVTLDLSAGQEGLHILYGPNEAGKSSALRALRQFFFGIPDRTADDFSHPYKNLRIGAKVRHSDGTVLDAVRRKARANPLRGPDDNTVVEAEMLQWFLGGLDQQTFETMFGIDHATLVEGGKEIVRGGGHFGEVLFNASAGLSGLRRVQDGLADEMRALFLPSGSNPVINRVVQKYGEIKRELRERQLSHEEWSRHDRELHEALCTKRKLETEAQENRRRQSRLSRIRNALHAMAARKQVLRDLETRKDSVVLRDDFSEEHRKIETELRLATQAAATAQAAGAEIENQLKQMDVPDALLEQAARVEDLYRRLGALQKNLEDRPTRELQKKAHEHSAKEIMQSLGKQPDLAQADQLRLSLQETGLIQSLGNKYQGLVANRDNAQKSIDTHQERLAEVERKLGQTPAPRDTPELRREIERTLKLGEPENDLLGLEQALAAAEEVAKLDLARLPYWSGSLGTLEALPPLSEETIQEFDKALADLNQRGTLLDQRRQDVARKLHSVEERIRRLQLEQEVPTEEGLKLARQQRARGWGLVRRAWLENTADDAAANKFVTELAAGRDLAAAHSVAQADEVVDRLRRESDRVAQHANLNTERDGLRLQLDELTLQQKECSDSTEAKQQEWAQLLRKRGMPALRHSEIRGWTQAQVDLIAQAREIRHKRAEIDHLRETIANTCSRLGACLEGLGEPGPPAGRDLGGLLEQCQQVVKRCDSLQSMRSKLQENRDDHERDLHTAQSEATKADEHLATWHKQWTPLMARIGLGSEALPDTANAYLASIAELFQQLREADVLRRRIAGMDRDIDKFTEDARALSSQVAPDQTERTAEEIAIELHARLTRARTAFQDRKNLKERQAEEADRLREADAKIRSAKTQLESLCKEARCASAAELPQAEERSQARKVLEKELHGAEEQIRRLSAGATVEEMVAEAAEIDADSLDSEIERLDRRHQELVEESSRVDQAIGSERTELARMDGNAAAADAAATAEGLLAQLQAQVPHYVTMRLASSILQRAVDRYRQKNQGPVLERANRLFAALTVGSFAGLRINYDEPDPVLEGVRADGTPVGVAGMSDGSCDQLYLALRLATLELWLSNHEPVPFIVDDVLVQFDDERAAATLKALAELARQTQVIFFTHHRHLVALARRHLTDDDVVFHELLGRNGAGGKRIPAMLFN